MKYKDTFIKYYIINPIVDIYYDLLEEVLDYWWCIDCKKYHSRRVIKYAKNRYEKGFKIWEGVACNETKELK